MNFSGYSPSVGFSKFFYSHVFSFLCVCFQDKVLRDAKSDEARLKFYMSNVCFFFPYGFYVCFFKFEAYVFISSLFLCMQKVKQLKRKLTSSRVDKVLHFPLFPHASCSCTKFGRS
jgi:hypothetical protein